jgi:hypothetical protein
MRTAFERTHGDGNVTVNTSGRPFVARDPAADHEQKRVALGVEKIVNDITATGGLSVFIPFTN